MIKISLNKNPTKGNITKILDVLRFTDLNTELFFISKTFALKKNRLMGRMKDPRQGWEGVRLSYELRKGEASASRGELERLGGS